jgi:hypothetical protein
LGNLDASTDYGVYILESNAADNTDWGEDPGDADMSTYTEGSEYLYIANPFRKERVGAFACDYTEMGNGKNMLFTYGYETGGYTVSGKMAGIDADEKVEHFCKRHNRSDAHDLYLVILIGADDFSEFNDDSHSAKKYVRVHIDNFSCVQSDVQNLIWEVRLQMRFLFS